MDNLVHLSRDLRGGLYTQVYKNAKYRKVIFGTNPVQIALGAKCPSEGPTKEAPAVSTETVEWYAPAVL